MAPPALPGYRNLAQRALTAGAWQENRGRLLLSVAGVALGVALGVAVHLINGQSSSRSPRLSGDATSRPRPPRV
jgi:hypothetical protein